MFIPPRISRKEAQEQGQSWYFTGKPCRFEHVDYRCVSSRTCQACMLARFVASQTDDPASVLSLLLRGNHERAGEYIRIVGTKLLVDQGFFPFLPFSSRLKLPNFIDGEPVTWGQSYGRIIYFTNFLEGKLSNHHLVRRATPKWANKKLIQAFYEERNRRRAQDNVTWVVDHIIPLHHPRVCGLHVHNNLQVITMLENTQRRGMFVEETTVFSYSHSGWNNLIERIVPSD